MAGVLGACAWSVGQALQRPLPTAELEQEAGALGFFLTGRVWDDMKLAVDGFHSQYGAYAWLSDPEHKQFYHPEWVQKTFPGAVQADMAELASKIPQGTAFMVSGPPARVAYVAPAGGSVRLILCIPNWDAPLAEAREELRWRLQIVSAVALLGVLLLAAWAARPLQQMADFAGDILDGKNVGGPETSIRELALIEAAVNELERSRRKSIQIMATGTPSTLLDMDDPVKLRQAITERIVGKLPFAAGLLDLSHFNGYNRRYGFTKGDNVLQKIGNLLKGILQEQSPDFSMLAHLGADRFTFLVPPTRVEAICAEFMNRFDATVPSFYTPEEFKAGFINVKNRAGEVRQVPVMQAVIAVSTNTKRPIHHVVQVEFILDEIRTFLKQARKSAYLLDRRTGGDEELLTGTTPTATLVEPEFTKTGTLVVPSKPEPESPPAES